LQIDGIEREEDQESELLNDDAICNQDPFESMQLEQVNGN